MRIGFIHTIGKQGANDDRRKRKKAVEAVVTVEMTEKGKQPDPQSLELEEELSDLDIEQVADASCTWTKARP